jgi:ribose 5-phosphate isomerase RpiB
MRVYLGSDHAGFELKQAIIEHLQNAGHETIIRRSASPPRRRPSPIRAASAS